MTHPKAQPTPPVSAHAPLEMYQAWLQTGHITKDDGQRKIAEVLQILFDQISAPEFLKEKNRVLKLFDLRKNAMPARCGAYIWGGVGRGKSMLMDMFFDLLPLAQKRRIHFHAFMLDVHRRMHAWRQLKPDDDLVEKVVSELADEFRVLCLDEFQVHDITDAMILSRLFSGLFEEGVVIIATSNRPPKDLYLGGIQREQFLKCIELIGDRMLVAELASAQDYRLTKLQALRQTYVHPLGEDALEDLMESYSALTDNHASEPLTLHIQGRTLMLEKTSRGVAWCTFAELCERPLGAADYLEIASVFHTLILQDIPQLSPEMRNEAKRFVTLIDALYDHKVNFICSAAAAPDKLYPAGDGSFEFGRTVSRLIEMQSEPYLAASHISKVAI